MPSSSVRTFDDPTEYGAAVRASNTELFVLGRGQFSAKLTRIDLHRVWMQSFSDTLPRIARARPVPTRVFISFPTRPRVGSLVGRPERRLGIGLPTWLGTGNHPAIRRQSGMVDDVASRRKNVSAVSTLAERDAKVPGLRTDLPAVGAGTCKATISSRRSEPPR